MQYCERPEQRLKLEQAFAKVAGRNIRLDFVLLPDDSKAATAVERTAPRPTNRRQRQQELLRHPLIRKAAELFDTEIIGLFDAPPAEAAHEPPN